jgi:hypothetical protein
MQGISVFSFVQQQQGAGCPWIPAQRVISFPFSLVAA